MSNKLIFIVTFLMFFPVGCSLINDFSADVLQNALKTKVSSENVPKDFPLIVQLPHAEPQLIPYSQLELITEQPIVFGYDPEAISRLEQDKASIQGQVDDTNAPTVTPTPSSTTPSMTPEHKPGQAWRLVLFKVLDQLSHDRVQLLVRAQSPDGKTHTSWYIVNHKEPHLENWIPTHYLVRGKLPLQVMTLPFSILITGFLWFWHLKRLRNMAQWKARMQEPQ